MSTDTSPNIKWIRIISFLMIACLIGVYLYLFHIGKAQILMKTIQNLGFLGIIIGIVIQSLVNIIPVPGEFISIILMEIYGPVWGGVYSWIGGLLGATGAFFLTKWIAKPFFGKLAQPYLIKMETFIKRHEKSGLLLIRFVPLLPYHFINYAAGLLQISLWSFIWTTAIGILPYTIGMSTIYAGVRKGSWVWGIAGGILLALLIFLGWKAKKKQESIE